MEGELYAISWLGDSTHSSFFKRLAFATLRVMPTVTYLEAIRQGIWEEMERDPSVFCIGEDIGIYGGAFKVTDGFIDRFGAARVIDTPIAESAIVGAAFGVWLRGMRPVRSFKSLDFTGSPFTQMLIWWPRRTTGGELRLRWCC